MTDIKDFVEVYYGLSIVDNITVKEFQELKQKNGIEDWDYPLEEYKHIAEEDLNCVAVRFAGDFGGYDYRFCEVQNA